MKNRAGQVETEVGQRTRESQNLTGAMGDSAIRTLMMTTEKLGERRLRKKALSSVVGCVCLKLIYE